ncbi:hypothetical protein Ami103574_15320 [Aminipila butyrica]|uniref:Uncharacterized protein n=1 Tax=Aminipila butyrica TaxID=433296 RepID=A0A858BZB2_9FIRM|nr:hypothetical protein [Aminipila butyrica]QIB70579.1 hypothetical protein Ami103574_15320 [Aminipila butyrica]
MNATTNMDCIDSGTENCPCYLAATGDCLICSRLQGKDYCDCLWKGVCIYNEFTQNGERINNPRRDFSARILSKETYLEDLFALTLSVGRGFALKAAVPGSYVFLQAPDTPAYYQTPISVMSADGAQGTITLLIKGISAKTKAICAQEEELILRGVYRGGISQLESIRGRFGRLLPDSKLLVLTKGVGFAPAVNLLHWAGKEAVSALLVDTDKLAEAAVWENLPSDFPREQVRLTSLSEYLEAEKFQQLIEETRCTALVVLASDFYIEEIRRLLASMPEPPALISSKNANLCCGEGICGACSCVSADGTVHKRCKCL